MNLTPSFTFMLLYKYCRKTFLLVKYKSYYLLYFQMARWKLMKRTEWVFCYSMDDLKLCFFYYPPFSGIASSFGTIGMDMWCLHLMWPCCVAFGWVLIWVVSTDWFEEYYYYYYYYYYYSYYYYYYINNSYLFLEIFWWLAQGNSIHH